MIIKQDNVNSYDMVLISSNLDDAQMVAINNCNPELFKWAYTEDKKSDNLFMLAVKNSTGIAKYVCEFGHEITLCVIVEAIIVNNKAFIKWVYDNNKMDRDILIDICNECDYDLADLIS